MKITFLIFASLFFINVNNAQQTSTEFFNQVDEFLTEHVKGNAVNYTAVTKDQKLNSLVNSISKTPLSSIPQDHQKAYLINVYNLFVINGISQSYPINSVQSNNGFFNRTKYTIGGQKHTLNEIEKDLLIAKYKDARLHFVLVCGAKGCPPITNKAYRPATLDAQLERQTKSAVNDPNFISIETNQIVISEIFKWYPADFGGKSNIIPFINKYLSKNPLPKSTKIKYSNYDWTLNDTNKSSSSAVQAQGANAYRYVVSAAIPKGGFEFKLFNNLYTQRTGDGNELNFRSSFFTSSLSALYGVTSRFNAGLEVRYRRVSNLSLPSSPFSVFDNGESATHRSGITSIGPRIRFAPFKSLENFSVQTTLAFPIGNELTGNESQPFIDWNGATFNTQLFNDHSLGSNFSIFTELDFLVEDIGGLGRFSTPVTGILSYFPNKKTTIYGLASYSPYWQADFDYFAQAGIGAKYQVSDSFEIELLGTVFSNQFLQQNNGDAATYNIGFRYSY